MIDSPFIKYILRKERVKSTHENSAESRYLLYIQNALPDDPKNWGERIFIGSEESLDEIIMYTFPDVHSRLREGGKKLKYGGETAVIYKRTVPAR